MDRKCNRMDEVSVTAALRSMLNISLNSHREEYLGTESYFFQNIMGSVPMLFTAFVIPAKAGKRAAASFEVRPSSQLPSTYNQRLGWRTLAA